MDLKNKNKYELILYFIVRLLHYMYTYSTHSKKSKIFLDYLSSYLQIILCYLKTS